MNDRLIDLLIEFDEMGFVPTTVCEDAEEYAKRWKDQVLEEVKAIEAENAVLRERLDKAVELPSGDRVWFITEDEEGKESYIIPKPTSSLTVEELKYEMDKKYFTTREAAEKRLAELNRGKQ